MASDVLEKMERTFPLEEKFIDHSGHPRPFRISLRKLVAKDFVVEATELSHHEGYHFEVYGTVYSVPALGSALGKLRRKVRKGLATRYLYADEEGQETMMHDNLCGRISCDGIVVDGALLHFKDLERILTTHEGFEISIRISDPFPCRSLNELRCRGSSHLPPRTSDVCFRARSAYTAGTANTKAVWQAVLRPLGR